MRNKSELLKHYRYRELQKQIMFYHNGNDLVTQRDID